MKAKTYKVPFDVYLPATKACPQTGKALDSKFIKTIMIDVYDNFGEQMLTELAHLQIDKEKILAILATFIDDDMWTVDRTGELSGRSETPLICL
jgi:hypothetical protein